nr:TPA_asm: hypothetical protein HUJ06_022497 [Nelumbo nucifera]
MASSSSMVIHEGSSSSSISRWDYDVFLNFRGEDTRKNFTDHLYEALHRVAIRTFRDDGRLKRGEEIEPALLKSIEQSRIAIIVFSRNYASSTWCLKELAKIMECRERMDQMVFPIFYDANPSDVRNQTGDFGEEFDKVKQRANMEMKKVESWEAALRKAANLSGWD